MKKTLFPVLFGAVLLGGAVHYYWKRPPLAKVVATLDPSESMQRNCAGFAQGARQWLIGKPGIRQGSTLTMLVMGMDAVNPEPRPVFTYAIPIDDGNVIGGDPNAYKKALDSLFGEVGQACEAAKAGRQSPVYRMMRQAIDIVRGPDGSGHGYVLVKSDLDDDAHPVLSAVLREAARNPAVAVPEELLGSLANANVAIHICGTAELAPRKGKAATASFDTLLRIWKAMATHPELITTQPYCGVS